MAKNKYITKNVVLEPTDFRVVRGLADRFGLGQRGFSVALRFIIREWNELKQQASPTNGNSQDRNAQA